MALKAILGVTVEGPLKGQFAGEVRAHLVNQVEQKVRAVQGEQVGLLETVEVQRVLLIDRRDLLQGCVQLGEV